MYDGNNSSPAPLPHFPLPFPHLCAVVPPIGASPHGLFQVLSERWLHAEDCGWGPGARLLPGLQDRGRQAPALHPALPKWAPRSSQAGAVPNVPRLFLTSKSIRSSPSVSPWPVRKGLCRVLVIRRNLPNSSGSQGTCSFCDSYSTQGLHLPFWYCYCPALFLTRLASVGRQEMSTYSWVTLLYCWDSFLAWEAV